MAVESAVGQWLRTGALYATAQDTDMSRRWGDLAVATETLSALAFEQDAAAEGSRQLAFFSGPLAEDTLIVSGARRDLLGQPHIDGAEVVFVIGYDEGDGSGADTTRLTVLRRMR